MKIFKNFIGLAALALCLGFASCGSDDDAPSYSNVAVSNSELMTILKGKGYQFDENGKMLLDDKANSTTSLDLSGTKVDTAALKELSVFPNLKELNLATMAMVQFSISLHFLHRLQVLTCKAMTSMTSTAW